MKLYDNVRLKVDKEKYAAIGLSKGSIGAIVLPEIRYNTFEVEFFDVKKGCYPLMEVYVGDMEVISESDITDEHILAELPDRNPKWWCKVVDGYIVNLKGDRKNKIPYDYES